MRSLSGETRVDGTVTSVVVLVESDISGGLNILEGRVKGLALLHERVVIVPGPGFSAGAVVLGLHKGTPGVIFNLGRPDEEKTIDGR